MAGRQAARVYRTPDDPEIVDAEQVAKMLGVTVEKARELLGNEIPCRAPGKRKLTTKRAVYAYLDSLPVKP